MLQEHQWTSLLWGTTRHLPSRDTVALLCYHSAFVRYLLPPSHLSNLAYRIRVFGEKWPIIYNSVGRQRYLYPPRRGDVHHLCRNRGQPAIPASGMVQLFRGGCCHSRFDPVFPSDLHYVKVAVCG